MPDGRRAGERHRIDLALEQHAVDALRAAFAAADRRVGRHFLDLAAGGSQLLDEQLARDLGPRQQEPRVVHRTNLGKGLHDPLRAIVRSGERDAHAVLGDRRCRAGADGADPGPLADRGCRGATGTAS